MASTNRLLSFLFLGAIAAAISACASPAVQECGATGIYCPSGTHCAAAQGICLPDTNTCGNAHLDPGEVCDDGNTNDGDGCSHDCKSDEKCGNHIVDVTALVPEVCDDGNTEDGDGCSHDCLSLEKCGNGIKDIHEECDDGNTDPGDGCSPRCTIERCGNGILDPGEACDLLPVDTTRCSEDCKSTRMCGNGIIDPGEECDLGGLNSNSGDCRIDCVFNRCGDGFQNTLGSVGHPEHIEQCDDAPQAMSFSRTVTPTETAGCNIDCTTARCGDGKVNALNKLSPATAIGEQCDDGNNIDGDGCDNNCTITGCGNGIVDPGEQCDDGNTVNGDGCDNNCKTTRCGNGILTAGEQCDDGNTASDDGCSTNCIIEFCGDGSKNDSTEQCDTGTISSTCNGDCTVAACGDGKINHLFTPAGAPGPEQCDDGNTNDNDGCSSKCQFEFCGDGTKNNIIEQCDTAGNSQTCNTDCTLPRCGDGKLNPNFTPAGALGPEQCDDGNNIDNDGCSSTCQFERCGNNIVDPGEQCDGSPVNGFACLKCHLVKCGDGIVDTAFGEQCDDGNASANDDCVSNNPDPTTCKIAVCGDGVQNTNREECDHGATNGTPGDTCSATCHNVTCGNGIIEQGETCDDGPPVTNNGAHKSCNGSCHRNTCGDGDTLTGIEQCDSGGVDTTACDADCTLPVCGDGHQNIAAGEDCDDGPLNGTSGDACDAFCHIKGCGNGFVDFGEQCDPGAVGVNTSTCDKDCTLPICGDGLTNGQTLPIAEVCDEGSANGDVCPYGSPGCTRCNSTCTSLVSPGGPFCGDAVKNGPEVCDQGSLLNGSQCAYGDKTCLGGSASTICAADCTGFVQNPNGPFCGDGSVQAQFNEQCDPGTGLNPVDSSTCDLDCSFAICGDGHKNIAAGEACDDGNTDSCGSCSADCKTPVTSLQATGSIGVLAIVANIKDGDQFTLNDGFHPAVTFEFDEGNQVTAGNVRIALDRSVDGDNEVGTRIAAAINGLSLLDITAAFTNGDAAVALSNDHKTSIGNKAIIPSVSATSTLTVTGMSGGVGGDCPANIGCATAADCASGSCNLATRRCQ